MENYRVLDPQKLRAARGSRSQADIASAAGNVFKYQHLSAWERGLHVPHRKFIPALLVALGVTWHDISTDIDEPQNVQEAA